MWAFEVLENTAGHRQAHEGVLNLVQHIGVCGPENPEIKQRKGRAQVELGLVSAKPDKVSD